MFINEGRFHYDFTTDFDNAMPLITVFILPYILRYPFWFLVYVFVGKYTNQSHIEKILLIDAISKLICGIIYVIVPTTNMRPELEISGICDFMTSFIWSCDSPPTNLFPALHCEASMICILSTIGIDAIKPSSKAFIWMFSIIIFLSTQFTKQHYIIDLIGGIAIPLLVYFIIKAFENRGKDFTG